MIKYEIGEKVYWTDPCEDMSSGIYTVVGIPDIEDEELEEFGGYEDLIFRLENIYGSYAEVFAGELTKIEKESSI